MQNCQQNDVNLSNECGQLTNHALILIWKATYKTKEGFSLQKVTVEYILQLQLPNVLATP